MRTTTAAAADYLERVRTELADLPAGELEEVLDDVAGHLEEVASEIGDDLESRLGTPREYAAELRAAAGYPAAGSTLKTEHDATPALVLGIGATLLLPACALVWMSPVAGLDSLVLLAALGFTPSVLGVLALRGRDPRIVTTHPAWIRGAAWLNARADQLPVPVRRELVAVGQPGWWMIRGALAGLAVYASVRGEGSLGNLLFAALGALVSVVVGRVSQRDRRWLWFVVPANVAAVLGLIVLAGALDLPGRATDGGAVGVETPNGIWVDGDPISNIFVFDEQGRAGPNARLYDQGRRPIALAGEERCPDADGFPPPSGTDNVFPNVTVEWSTDGAQCTERNGPTFTLPPLAARPTPTTTATSTPTPTPTPTPRPTR